MNFCNSTVMHMVPRKGYSYHPWKLLEFQYVMTLDTQRGCVSVCELTLDNVVVLGTEAMCCDRVAPTVYWHHR